MKNVLIATIAALSCVSLGFAQGSAKKFKEPKCCKGLQCHHTLGEAKHHKCNKHCHSKAQPKGECCNGYSPKPVHKKKKG